ncbi:pyruvate formate lyase activating enzyme [Dethiosulfatibacter aminovorans DSM 17477]|uniref:Pyruvate formate-lyase-activating enzyme n=1 Tax=Dethiosulfatibacter aminovorans DSM 17477 TaxID=1121476 RepID=A0A1M6L0T3_9FIRM|nr:pyruvate formate-lyase-activating protein [Dethiosulfatibacter aminovorans]SHJ64734.1 pyruvate formate lyase activating enzyme [Dethiosulfatibacter aminovorans DSM 17477]
MIKVHSIETMGALDGPGLRIIFFLQGCPLRCLYCHNPDTWKTSGGNEYSSSEIIEKALRYKPYFIKNNGGITFSGGEPLLQAEELIETMKLAKENGLHTALDTSGYYTCSDSVISELLEYTDLVILDIKHEERDMYKKITGLEIDKHRKFKDILKKAKSKIWLKHVVVPGLTDDVEHMESLEKEVRTFPLERVEKFELLPYHSLGEMKYEELGMEYPLKDTEEMDMDKLKELKKHIKLDCLI